MSFDRLKALRADHMFDPACVLRCDFRVNPQSLQPGREECVPFVDPVRDLLSGWGEGDIAFRGDRDIPVFAEFFHCHADTGFFEVQFCGNVDRTYDRTLPA